MSPVERWFGPGFATLHPLLQDLHRHGGELRGPIEFSIGRGLGGILGRRLARKLGIPLDGAHPEFVVRIQHVDGRLHWSRRIGSAPAVVSIFEPIGTRPSGYWIEAKDWMSMHLDVEVRDGGWYWRCMRMYVGGMRIPLWLAPRVNAWKCIEDGRYRFVVRLSLPGIGTLLQYGGLLEIAARGQP